ncbi:hypothetical protein CN505_31215, partial [Bacillus cereus]
DGTPQSGTSAILEIDFAFGSKNPTDVSQLAALAVGVSKGLLLFINKFKIFCYVKPVYMMNT